jgi:hypothetical protein
MTGYDEKELTISTEAATTVTVEVDLTGMGDWVVYRAFELAAGAEQKHQFPDGFEAYWVRCRAADDTVARAEFEYR